MKQELSLTEEEVAAVDDGLTALDTLQQKLTDVPTPAGLTPRQLQATNQHAAFISVQTVQRKPSKGEYEGMVNDLKGGQNLTRRVGNCPEGWK